MPPELPPESPSSTPGDPGAGGVPRGAMVIIYNSAGAVLMQQLDDVIPGVVESARWSLPSRAFTSGEPPEQAIVREVHDQTCLTVPDLRRFPFEVHDETGSGQFLSVYAGVCGGDLGTGLAGEGRQWRWVTFTELKALDIPSHVRDLLLIPVAPMMVLLFDPGTTGNTIPRART